MKCHPARSATPAAGSCKRPSNLQFQEHIQAKLLRAACRMGNLLPMRFCRAVRAAWVTKLPILRAARCDSMFHKSYKGNLHGWSRRAGIWRRQTDGGCPCAFAHRSAAQTRCHPSICIGSVLAANGSSDGFGVSARKKTAATCFGGSRYSCFLFYARSDGEMFSPCFCFASFSLVRILANVS